VLATAVTSGLAGGPADVVRRAAASAYERAGIGPADVDVAEVHDAAAPAELLLGEELGFVAAGDGPKLVRDGISSIGGGLPINPSGGLLARGHPIGATGAAQLAELTWQLRGAADGRQVDGARIGLAENAGGSLGNGPAACAVTILAAAPTAAGR